MMEIKNIFREILEISVEKKYPDVHITTGSLPIIRYHNGDLTKIKELKVGEEIIKVEKLRKEDIEEIIVIIAGKDGLIKFKNNFELDCSYDFENKERYRVNCYVDSSGYSIALRLIPSKIPTLEDLGLGKNIKSLCDKNKGLILITGPTGSGKSTNLAGMINYINNKYKKHIITIEDPVEFSFKSINCLVNQREIGNHTKGFPEAIRASLREDPDIIMVGEMRDPETIRAAITLAETGHLVLSTLHTNDTVQSIDRIIDVFPSGQQEQIRTQLALNLTGVISQRLVPRKDKNGRIAAREILINDDAVKNLIITGKTHQLYSIIEVSSKKGMILMDKYLQLLYKKGTISKEVLFSYVRDKEGMEMLIG